MAFYSAYLIRYGGVILMSAFIPYLHLWPYISGAHLIIFAIFGLYEPPANFSKKQVFINTLNASIISALTSISIVYTMRYFYGFMPSAVFALALLFNIILVCGWRVFVRYENLST
jgi:FlaA1/EpsC-like NDP-sugar epimerase